MSSTGKALTPYDIIADWGLTPREAEVALKGLSIMLKNDKQLKPDYKELAEAADFKSGSSAGKCWWHLREKLKAGAAANPTSKTSKSRNKTNVKTNKANTKTNKKADTKANKKANTKANIKAETEANTDVETEGNTDDETEVDTDDETEAGTDVEIEGNTDVETETNTESETEAGTDGDTETGTDGEADAIVEVEAEAEAEGMAIVSSVDTTSSNKRKDAPTPAATAKPVVRPAIGLTGDEPWDVEPEEYEEEGFVFEHDSDYSPGTWDAIYDTLLKE